LPLWQCTDHLLSKLLLFPLLLLLVLLLLVLVLLSCTDC
jgi:hypothetical protein